MSKKELGDCLACGWSSEQCKAMERKKGVPCCEVCNHPPVEKKKGDDAAKKKPKPYEPRALCKNCNIPTKTLYERVGKAGTCKATDLRYCPRCKSFFRK